MDKLGLQQIIWYYGNVIFIFATRWEQETTYKQATGSCNTFGNHSALQVRMCHIKVNILWYYIEHYLSLGLYFFSKKETVTNNIKLEKNVINPTKLICDQRCINLFKLQFSSFHYANWIKWLNSNVCGM